MGYEKHECPDIVDAGLAYLSHEIQRVMWNNTQENFPNPFDNTGNSFSNDVFSVHAYYWGDECECGDKSKLNCPNCRPNFKCGDFEVRWYKYLGRGMSINRHIDANEFAAIFDKCLDSVRKMEKSRDYSRTP